MQNKIKIFYENYDEDGRLFRDKAHLPEYLTTIRYFDRLFPRNSRVLDACAGTGRYSFYLADRGHIVTACDLVEHNIDIIKSNPKAENLSNILQCNVLDMPRFEDSSFDVVLCMGAMYHLPSEKEKVQAIKECTMVCRTGGLIVLSYLNYFAVVAADVQKGLSNLKDILASLNEGSDNLWKSTTPSKIEQNAKGAGLEILYNIGTDGISFVIADKVNAAADEDFETWIEYIYEHCEEMSTLGYSMHGLLITKKK